MQSLRIDTGIKRIPIERDGETVGFLEFDPESVVFAERFYQLLRNFQAKQAEYQTRSKVLDENKEKDEHGLPVNLGDGIAFVREVCEYMRGQIDLLFGEGTSQKLFGDTLKLEVFDQFFNGIAPMIETARAEKVTRYANEKFAGRVME